MKHRNSVSYLEFGCRSAAASKAALFFLNPLFLGFKPVLFELFYF